MFMDSNSPTTKQIKNKFIQIRSENGAVVRLTPNHLIFTSSVMSSMTSSPPKHFRVLRDRKLQKSINDHSHSNKLKKDLDIQRPDIEGILTEPAAIFAHKVKEGDYIFVASKQQEGTAVDLSFSGTIAPSRVLSVTTTVSSSGSYAPLTSRGNIVVDHVSASCYAVLYSHRVAHWVMTPMRLYHETRNWWYGDQLPSKEQLKSSDGVHWYPNLWYYIGSMTLPRSIFKGL